MDNGQLRWIVNSFTRHFYKPQPLRTLEEIRTDLKSLQAEAEGMIDMIIACGDESTEIERKPLASGRTARGGRQP